MTKKDWCQQNGILLRSLMHWQRKFRLEALAQLENSQTAMALPTIQSPAFADLTPKLQELQPDPEPGLSGSPVTAPELMIQSGSYRIYVNSSIREATLETVLKVLSRA